jgi:hypothetical protein
VSGRLTPHVVVSVVGPFSFQSLTRDTSLAVVLHVPVVSLEEEVFLDDTTIEHGENG